LLKGCLARLAELGIESSRAAVHRVPGAFELPVTALRLARTRQFSAIICLGAVIRGDTPHFDFVAGQCAHGIQQVALSEDLPVIFGVLTTNTQQQAEDRIGGAHSHAGRNAGQAAVEMIACFQRISRDNGR
jgi:6,7-dimethyl-8-ribityllumazine synthase